MLPANGKHLLSIYRVGTGETVGNTGNTELSVILVLFDQVDSTS